MPGLHSTSPHPQTPKGPLPREALGDVDAPSYPNVGRGMDFQPLRLPSTVRPQQSLPLLGHQVHKAHEVFIENQSAAPAPQLPSHPQAAQHRAAALHKTFSQHQAGSTRRPTQLLSQLCLHNCRAAQQQVACRGKVPSVQGRQRFLQGVLEDFCSAWHSPSHPHRNKNMKR